MTASPFPPPEGERRRGVEPDGRQRANAAIPFHALFLALVVPALAAIILLAAFGAQPLGLALVLAALAPAYFIGFAPAFLAGRFDQSLAEKGWSAVTRLSVMAGIAWATGMAIVIPLHLAGHIHGAMPLLFPLALVLSAVLGLGSALFLARLAFRRSRRPGTWSPP